MRSGTSYFNRTLFFKTAGRFWPLWFFYAAVWFVVMPLMTGANLRFGGSALAMQHDILAMANTGGVMIGFISACVAVMAVWSFMYSSRSAGGMACLPIRREGVFLSVSLAGIAPLLIINVLIFLLTLGVQGLYNAVDVSVLGQWLGAVTLELIFYYGFALLCAQLTGNLAVLPAVYLVLSFTAYAVEVIASSLVSTFVYGAAGCDLMSVSLTPPLGMMLYSEVSSDRVYNAAGEFYETTRYYLTGWGALAIYAAVGIAFAALALWLYRRRRMESAGDVVAVGVLKPVFKYCMTFGGALCIGALLYGLTSPRGLNTWLSASAISGGAMYRSGVISSQALALAVMILYMLIGAFIGYFASEMLIHKSFRVWRGKRRWLGLGVSALIIAALMVSVELDMYGYERRVPDPDRVRSVYIAAPNNGVTLTQPENIAAAVELHRGVVKNKRYYEGVVTAYSTMCDVYNPNDGRECTGSVSLRVVYTLKNGSTLARNYPSLFYTDDPASQADARAAQTLLNTPEAIACRKATAVELNAETIFDASVHAKILHGDIEKASETGEVYDIHGDRVTGVTGSSAFDYETADGKYASLTAEEKAALAAGQDTGYFSANWSLTPEEASELYNECILPDMAEGTIGTVWIITDEEYESTVYALRISIDARVPRTMFATHGPGSIYSDPYEYEYFYTVPTVNSVRTNRWLEEHGIILRTVGEAGKI